MIGIIGGTGPEGRGLAVRFGMANLAVMIGSRSRARAEEAAVAVQQIVASAAVTGDTNEAVVKASDIVIVSVPYNTIPGTIATLADNLHGKIVVSVVAAVEFAEGRPKPVLVAAGSVALEVQQLVPTARVTSGFHTLSAENLADVNAVLDEDTIICGDDRDARRAVMEIAGNISGIRPVSGGRLENSIYPELMVGMLATLNRIHKAKSGIKLTGIGTRTT